MYGNDSNRDKSSEAVAGPLCKELSEGIAQEQSKTAEALILLWDLEQPQTWQSLQRLVPKEDAIWQHCTTRPRANRCRQY